MTGKIKRISEGVDLLPFDSGKWIDLPQVGDGKGSDEVYGYTGPGAYIHEGPTVRVPANQVHFFLTSWEKKIKFGKP